MPAIQLLRHDLTIEEGSEYASLEHHINVSASLVNSLEHDLTITSNLADANETSYRLFGAKLEVDLGGGLEEISLSDLSGDLSISESFDGWADSITFTLRGRSYSPYLVGIGRGIRQVRLTGRLGVPGAIEERVLFDGYLHKASYVDDPPGLQISAYDGAGRHVGKRLVWSADPGSRETRKEIFQAICEEYSIDLGVQEWGPNDGGIIVKPISEGGDREVLEFLREFVVPIGRVLYFRDNRLNIIRPRVSVSADRSLTAQDMGRNLEVGLPAVTNANVITATGVVYEFAQVELGKSTTKITKTTTADYAPAVAVNKQSKADGSVSATGLASTSASRETERLIITETRLDGTVIYRKTERWSWYAPHVARYEQDTAGTISHNSEIDVYEYADGSWRSEPTESLRRTHVNEERYTYNDDGYLIRTQVTCWQYRPSLASHGQLTSRNPDTVGNFTECFVTHDGMSWAESEEVFDDPEGTTQSAIRIDTFDVDESGRILSQQSNARVWGMLSGTPSGTPYVFLKDGNSTPTSNNSGDEVFFYSFHPNIPATTMIAVYEPLLIDSIVFPGGGYAPTTVAKQEAMQARVTQKDAVQIALNGEHVYYIHNEAAELVEELRILAFEELREQGHWPVSFGMVEDLTTHKGSTVSITRPEHGMEGTKVFVWSVDRTFNFSEGSATLRIGAKYWPPELTD